MDCLTFAAKVLEATAWPLAAVLIVLLLRRELQALIPLIKKFKAGPLEVELEHLKKELTSTKNIAVAADAKAEVVAAKLDESEAPSESDKSAQKEEKRAQAVGLTDAELKVLKAMSESRFATRSISGVAKDSGLSKSVVQATYGSLIAKGLVKQTENAEGQPRWFVTGLGRSVVSES